MANACRSPSPALGVAELADEEARGAALLRGVRPPSSTGSILSTGLVLVAADVEVDEHGAAVRRETAARGTTFWTAATFERRAILTSPTTESKAGEPASKRAALDQDALAGGLLEPGVEDPVHPARLTGAGGAGIDLLRTELPADGEGGEDEGEPAEGGGLPVTGAPATHAGRDIGVRGSGRHVRSSLIRQRLRRYDRVVAASSERDRICTRTTR